MDKAKTEVPAVVIPRYSPGTPPKNYNKNKEFTFRSFGRAAAFTSAPLEISIANLDLNSQDKWQTQYEIPYQINGDWGGPKKGKFLLKVERTNV